MKQNASWGKKINTIATPLVRLRGEGNGTPLQYSCLENPRDGGAWWAAVHGVAKSQTWLSDFTFTFHFHALEKEMATHSSVLAWRVSGTGEPGGLPSMWLHRVGQDWSDLAAAAAAVRLRKKEDTNYWKLRNETGYHDRHCRNQKDDKGILWTTLHTYIWECRLNISIPWKSLVTITYWHKTDYLK